MSERIVAVVDDHVVILGPGDHGIEITPGSNLAGEARDTVTFDDARPLVAVDVSDGALSHTLELRGRLTRVALMAGALEEMASLTASYTRERQQFGKPIGSFQAVQALVVRSAEDAVLADIALQAAADAVENGAGEFEITAAKIVADAAVGSATRAAHQAHGAIGMTREYRLHHLSRRLWSWRAEYGNAALAVDLGRAVAGRGADDLYRLVADGSAAWTAV